MRPLAVGLAVALAAAGCVERDDNEARARTYRIESRSQRLGGPAAIAEPGDYVIENGVLRLAVLQEGNSPGPGMVGGSLIDIDRIVPDGRHGPNEGLDAFAELVPMVNLMVPGYSDDPGPRDTCKSLQVEIAATGDEATCPVAGGQVGCAAIRVTGKADRLVEALGTVQQLGVRMNLSFRTTFLLDPGTDYVRLITEFSIDNRVTMPDPPLEGEACQWPAEVRPLEPVTELVGSEHGGVFDILVGDNLVPNPDDRVWEPGFLAGDFLLFGKKVSVFAEGHGFDFGNSFQRMFDRGEDILGNPQAAEALVGVGQGISYAYASLDGPMIVPIYTGEFTGAFTHYRQCLTGDDACADGERNPLRYERVLAVGRGDVASALGVLYRLRDDAHGTFAGWVYDPRTGAPVSGAQVFLVADPAPEDPDQPFPRTAEEAMAANETRRGNPGLITELLTDPVGAGTRDGSFSGPVPPGSYYAVVRAPGRALSTPVRVAIDAGRTTRTALGLGNPGRVEFQVFDDTGAASPAKLTFVGPLGPDDPCGAGGVPELPLQSSARPLPLGGGEIANRVAGMAYTATGEGAVEIEPGRYDLWISRGFEYSIDRRCLEVPPYTPARVNGFVRREVDTTGYVAGDFHMHGMASYDADTPYDRRVVAAIAEGVEVLAIADHDVVTDIGAYVKELGLRHRLLASTAEEVTPIETGHIIGFPLRYDATAPEHGALDWTRRDECLLDPTQPVCNHEGIEGFVLPLTPGEVFDRLRALGSQGPDDTFVFAPHPRDGFFGLFDQFGLNAFDDTFFSPGLMRGQHPLLRPEPYFGWDFDALELFNSKRVDMSRIPTVREVFKFGSDLSALRTAGGSEADIARLHLSYAREVLTRTGSEQALLRFSRTPECLDEGLPCGEGEACDPQRRVCVAEGVRCSGDDDCADGQTCSFELRPSRCVEECAVDDDCRIDSTCVLSATNNRRHCVPRTCGRAEETASPDAPCVQKESPARPGVVDDWFRLLNHGEVYTGLGNSDSHTLTSLETGCPRNWIRVGTDDPGALDERTLVRGLKAGRVVASFGPFVELFVDGRPIGDTVPLAPGDRTVTVEVRVQWPSWFDVDRVEIYRSGELLPETYVPSASPFRYSFEDELPVREDGTVADAWYAAIALNSMNCRGEQTADCELTRPARTLAPVYVSNRHPYLGFSQVISVTFATIEDPLLQAVVAAPLPVPEEVPVVPYAITNPVFVDADGVPGYQGPLGPAPARRAQEAAAGE